MTRSTPTRRWAAVPALAAAAAAATVTAAWACVPEPEDKQTKISSCNPPPGALKPCKTPVGAPKFPEATFVKGPSGSSVVAYVTGPGVQILTSYDLVFASKLQLESGQRCSSSASVVIGGPMVSGRDGSIPATAGRIPANSPLGLSQVCFTDALRRQTEISSSTAAQFKVTV